MSRREALTLVGGALAGLLIIAVVWFLTTPEPSAALPPVAEVNREAPAFTLQTLDGQPVSLSDYRGKVVLLNFWYTGCAPCREETPALQRAYQQLADQGLVVLGVNVRENERAGQNGEQDIRAFVDQYGVSYPIVLDLNREVGSEYQVLVLPTSIFIDQHGRERYRSFSTVTTEDVEQIFSALQREAMVQRQ